MWEIPTETTSLFLLSQREMNPETQLGAQAWADATLQKHLQSQAVDKVIVDAEMVAYFMRVCAKSRRVAGTQAVQVLASLDVNGPTSPKSDAWYIIADVRARQLVAHLTTYLKAASRKRKATPSFTSQRTWSWPEDPERKCGSVTYRAIECAAHDNHLMCSLEPDLVLRRFLDKRLLLQLHCLEDGWELFIYNSIEKPIRTGLPFTNLVEMRDLLRRIANAQPCVGLTKEDLGVFAEEKHFIDAMNIDVHTDSIASHSRLCCNKCFVRFGDDPEVPPFKKLRLCVPCSKLKRNVVERMKRLEKQAAGGVKA